MQHFSYRSYVSARETLTSHVASICVWVCNSYGLTSVTEEFCSLPVVTCSDTTCPGIRHLNYIAKIELCRAAKLAGNRTVTLMVQGKQAMPQVLSTFSLKRVCLCRCSSSCHTTAYNYHTLACTLHYQS